MIKAVAKTQYEPRATVKETPSTNNPETPTATTTTTDVPLQNGANKNPLLNPRNWDMLSEENQLKHVQLLLKKGANIQPDSSTWVKDALLLSAGEQFWRVVDLLLQSISAYASLDELQRFGNSLPGRKVENKRTIKSLDRLYWRRRYPVS